MAEFAEGEVKGEVKAEVAKGEVKAEFADGEVKGEVKAEVAKGEVRVRFQRVRFRLSLQRLRLMAKV